MKMSAPLEIGISCESIERMVDFYTKFLSFELINVIDMPEEMARHVPLARAGYKVARLQTPNGERIKFLSTTEKRQQLPGLTDNILLRERTFFLTFIVEDLDQLLEALKSENVRTLTGYEKKEARPGFYLAFAVDPEGNVLELSQYDDVLSYRPDLVAT